MYFKYVLLEYLKDRDRFTIGAILLLPETIGIWITQGLLHYNMVVYNHWTGLLDSCYYFSFLVKCFVN